MDQSDDRRRGKGLDRRSVLRLTSGAVAGAAVNSMAKTSQAAPDASDIVMMDATGLAKSIRSRKLS
jgi:hypothetical protein